MFSDELECGARLRDGRRTLGVALVAAPPLVPPIVGTDEREHLVGRAGVHVLPLTQTLNQVAAHAYLLPEVGSAHSGTAKELFDLGQEVFSRSHAA